MNLSRRAFLGLAASAALPLRYGWTGTHADFRLRAAPCLAQILPDGEAQSQMLGYNGMTPGPQLRAMQGERLSFWLENGLDEGTSIHSHGIHVPNGMDGVPEPTQPLVQPGQSFQYSFVPYSRRDLLVSRPQPLLGAGGSRIVRSPDRWGDESAGGQ